MAQGGAAGGGAPQAPQGPPPGPESLMALLSAMMAGHGQIAPSGNGATEGSQSMAAILPMLLHAIQSGGMSMPPPQGQPQQGGSPGGQPQAPPAGGAAQPPQAQGPQLSPQVTNMIKMIQMLQGSHGAPAS